MVLNRTFGLQLAASSSGFHCTVRQTAYLCVHPPLFCLHLLDRGRMKAGLACVLISRGLDTIDCTKIPFLWHLPAFGCAHRTVDMSYSEDSPCAAVSHVITNA